MEERFQEKLVLLFRIFVTSVLSIGKALGGQGTLEAIMLFLMAFIVYNVVVKLLADTLEWLKEYLAYITPSIAFSIIMPMIILTFFNAINTPLKRQMMLGGLIISVLLVYLEMIRLITGQFHRQGIKRIGKALKIKTIITWLGIILMNLYALLVLIQFSGDIYPFIEAKCFNQKAAIELFYYLIITFTTVGFGDIYPHTVIAKLVTAIIALSGMLFSGMFIATILITEESLDDKRVD